MAPRTHAADNLKKKRTDGDRATLGHKDVPAYRMFYKSVKCLVLVGVIFYLNPPRRTEMFSQKLLRLKIIGFSRRDILFEPSS